MEDVLHFVPKSATENRQIFTLTIDGVDLLAKVALVRESEDTEYEKKGCFRGHLIENSVYKKLSIDDKCELIPECVYLLDYTNNTAHLAVCLDKQCIIDYSKWAETIMEPYIGFSIFVVKTQPQYETVFNELETKKIIYTHEIIETLFIDIMGKMLLLNKKYDFVHYDLKTDNIIIDPNKNIKFIDFDFSQLGNCFSENKLFFDNPDLISSLSHQDGFLFDFYRMYLSLCLWNRVHVFETNQYTQKINKIIDRVISVYKNRNIDIYVKKYDCIKVYIFNNAEYFGEWIMDPEVTYDNIVQFIENESDKT